MDPANTTTNVHWKYTKVYESHDLQTADANFGVIEYRVADWLNRGIVGRSAVQLNRSIKHAAQRHVVVLRTRLERSRHPNEGVSIQYFVAISKPTTALAAAPAVCTR